MTESDKIAAHLTVLETVVSQLITHMAVRDEDPPRWVQTRKALAINALDADGPRHAALLGDALADVFGQAELVASDYSPQDQARPDGQASLNPADEASLARHTPSPPRRPSIPDTGED